jgi:6-pyruvoyltetrahydropterin/6-carboxytetrahydropterin synthase
MYVLRTEVQFDAGHRVLGYPGKCASPHGHTFRAEVYVAIAQLDDLGMGIDFGEIRGKCKRWIDEHWDHGFLLNSADEALICGLRAVPEAKLYLFNRENPTAETMASELFRVFEEFGWCVQRVRIWETQTQFAEYWPSTFVPGW